MHKHPVAHWATCNRLNMFIEKNELKKLKNQERFRKEWIMEGIDYREVW